VTGDRAPAVALVLGPIARKVHASFTKFQALVGAWDHAAEGAYHQSVGA
jgi:hypothetical protein